MKPKKRQNQPELFYYQRSQIISMKHALVQLSNQINWERLEAKFDVTYKAFFMTDSYGHAKDFYNEKLKDGAMNRNRNLIQYQNAIKNKHTVNVLVVLNGHLGNRYGHVSIILSVKSNNIENIQQNAGAYASTRATYLLTNKKGFE